MRSLRQSVEHHLRKNDRQHKNEREVLITERGEDYWTYCKSFRDLYCRVWLQVVVRGQVQWIWTWRLGEEQADPQDTKIPLNFKEFSPEGVSPPSLPVSSPVSGRAVGMSTQMLEKFEISPFCPAILAHSRPFGFSLLLSIAGVYLILVSCLLNSRRATKRYHFGTSRIVIFQLGT